MNTVAATVHTKKRAPKGESRQATKRGPQIRGIGRRAAKLGVTRQHLWRVLHHERSSAPLMRRYADLVAAESAAKGTP